MKEDKSVVSIVIPVFNRKELVQEMIERIIAQTYIFWELLLIDDGSTEDTWDMLNKEAASDKRIKLYRRERTPKGAPTCRNIGLENAKGKYIIFYDSDDLIAPYALAQRVAFMEQHPDLDFAIFPAMSFTESIGEGNPYYEGINTGVNDLKHLVDALLPFLVVTNIYRISFLQQQKITWDERLASLQDADFNIRTILSGGKYSYADNADIDYYIRVIPNSSSISQGIRKRSHGDSHLYFLKKMQEELPLKWKKRNAWAIRRRFIYIFLFLQDERDYVQRMKHLIRKEDVVFYPLFCVSVFLFECLKKLSCPKPLSLAFPYYICYHKIYMYRMQRRISVFLKERNKSNSQKGA